MVTRATRKLAPFPITCTKLSVLVTIYFRISQTLVWEQWYSRGNFLKIFADQSRSVKGDLKNTINVVGNLVTRAKAFSEELKNSILGLA